MCAAEQTVAASSSTVLPGRTRTYGFTRAQAPVDASKINQGMEMKTKLVLAGIAATLVFASTTMAQPYRMGHGMMGGYGGPSGMGPGMMGGHGMMEGSTNNAYAGLNLTPEQHAAIAGIQEQASTSMWQHMGLMQGQGYAMQGLFGPGPLDEVTARRSLQSMTEAQQAMFELQLDARKKIDAVLTDEQRKTLGR